MPRVDIVFIYFIYYYIIIFFYFERIKLHILWGWGGEAIGFTVLASPPLLSYNHSSLSSLVFGCMFLLTNCASFCADTFQLKTNESFTKDVLFIEDDVIVSADFMESMWYAIAVKNSVSGVLLSSLQGVGGDNLIEHHPDTFVVSHVPVVHSACYAFNASAWKYIKKFEKDALDYSDKDWPLFLGLLFFYDRNGTTIKIVTPTISRIWHVGDNDLVGSTETSSQTYKPMKLPPWKTAREQRYLNRNKANTLPGTRDMYGRLCHPCELESRKYQFSSRTYQCHCLCPTSNLRKYWNWQVAGFSSETTSSMHCSLVSHLMGMVVCVLVGLSMFGYLMTSR